MAIMGYRKNGLAMHQRIRRKKNINVENVFIVDNTSSTYNIHKYTNFVILIKIGLSRFIKRQEIGNLEWYLFNKLQNYINILIYY